MSEQFVRDLGGEARVAADIRERFKTFVPRGDLFACQVHVDHVTTTGLSLPDGVVDPGCTPTATVIAVGPECKQIKEGDTVLLPATAAGWNAVHGDSGPVQVFREQQIMGVSIVKGRAKVDVDESLANGAGLRCPIVIKGEQCGLREGHEGKHRWSNGD